ncbi:hypothetical protein N665_4163s0001, partial [Sinapis alba]
CLNRFFPLPITKGLHLDNLYKLHGVDLASAFETPETIQERYCVAYLSFFKDCSLSFPIPEPILDILVELGLSFTQMCPNFLRHLLALTVKAREEGLLFGLDKVSHLCLMKRNNQSPETFLMCPRQGRQIIEGILYCDEKWRKRSLVFKVSQASLGNYDFSKLPHDWAEDIAHSGSSPMSDELRGLIQVLRRGCPHWSSCDRARIRAAFSLPRGEGRVSAIRKPAEGGLTRPLALKDGRTPFLLMMWRRSLF